MNEEPLADNLFDLSPEQRKVQLALLYRDLSAAIDRFEARIPTAEHIEEIAWIARYLLELHIWVKYCDHPERAEQFWQDHIRDLNQMNRTVGANDKLYPATRTLLQQAQKVLTGKTDPFKPPYLRAAAKAVSPEFEAYRNEHDAILSKLAHPTALSVPLFNDGDRDGKWRELLRVQARGYAEEARRDLKAGYLARVMASYTDAFRPIPTRYL